MKHFHYNDADEKEVTAFGSKKTTIRKFINEDEAPNFIMRRFEIQPGGHIGVHDHPWEHEMYILEGDLYLIDKDGNEELVKRDEFVFMPENEPHGYKNKSDRKASFICIIPKNVVQGHV